MIIYRRNSKGNFLINKIFYRIGHSIYLILIDYFILYIHSFYGEITFFKDFIKIFNFFFFFLNEIYKLFE